MKQLVIIVKPEQKRTDDTRASRVTESANHTIGAANLFHLYHGCALAGCVRRVQLLRDDAVEVATHLVEPLLGRTKIGGGRRQTNCAFSFEVLARELFEQRSPFA